MRSTKVDKATGEVRCPKCRGNNFASQRSIKGKIAGGLLAPKRLKCNGCGTMLKRSHI